MEARFLATRTILERLQARELSAWPRNCVGTGQSAGGTRYVAIELGGVSEITEELFLSRHKEPTLIGNGRMYGIQGFQADYLPE